MHRAVEARIEAGELRRIVEKLESFRSHPLGFRVAGTPAERQAADWIAAEMRAIGLHDVVLDPVPVDGWELREAHVEAGGARYECSSFGGVPGTPPGGVAGELVAVARGGRRELEGVDVTGRIVLLDWRDDDLWPFQSGLELGLRGAAALIVTCQPGGPYFQADGALGAFDGLWHVGAPPMVTIRKEDAALLAARGGEVRVHLDVRLTPDAEGANVVGFLPGRRTGRPILVGGHHDAWFTGSFDDATGVAAALVLARAFVEAGVRPRHPIGFLSHTAEEYGLANSRYDWCIGAWHQITHAHREWAARAPFYLNIEGSGLPEPLEVDAPPELAAWARRVCRRAARDGLLPHGFRLGEPNTLTEVWTFLAAGVPGLNVSSFSESWIRTDYHTQLDSAGEVDFDYLARLTRVFSRLLLAADDDPDAILDYGARAADVRRAVRRLSPTPARARLERSLSRLDGLSTRAAFTPLGRGLYGLDANGIQRYPHEQPARDAEELEAALAALAAGQHAVAGRRLARVGLNRLCRDLSQEAFERELSRNDGRTARLAWAVQGRQSRGPNLWPELASLAGEPGARPVGPWLERSLRGHLDRARADLERRLEQMAAAIDGRRSELPR